MAQKKYYAVRKGRKAGIFQTWDACRQSVSGYSGAEYKSFLTEQEAMEYLNGGGGSFSEEKNVPSNMVLAYVDGSFDKKIKKYSFGCVLILPDGGIVRESGNGNNPESLKLRNVTGEMLGAMFAVKWSMDHGYTAIKLCYDYMGIEMWATGGWAAKTELTQKYAAYMQRAGGRMHITYQKIAAHTGDKYNEEADQLAKKALTEGRGIPQTEETSRKDGGQL